MKKITILNWILLVGTTLCQDDYCKKEVGEEDIKSVEHCKKEVGEEDLKSVTVKTFLGSVKGQQMTTESGTSFFKFQGVPYAEAPVDNLRFKPPRPVKAWEDLDATKEGPMCPQMVVLGPDRGSLVGDEDCLHLNIYTPSIPSTDNNHDLKPVMLWIHGGAFVFGSGSMFGEPDLLLERDVVVVTINYRLGALGFMTFGNSKVSGNMGLKDQQMAIEWTKNNIAHFGGNPAKITIFGESAGGVSVHAHVLSPFNYGLLAGGIAQSGTMLMTPSARHPQDMAEKTAELMDCSSQLDEETLKCLLEVPVNDLLKKTSSGVAFTEKERREMLMMNWWPVHDFYASEPFIPVDPIEAMLTGQYNQVPFMTGTNENEGGLFLPFNHFEEVSDGWDVLGPGMTKLDLSSDADNISQESIDLCNMIKQYYTGSSFGLENLQNTVDIFTDSIFLAPDQKTVSLMSQGKAPIYNYVLTYRGKNSFAGIFHGEDAKDIDIGATHVDDLIYLLKSPLFSLDTEEEMELSSFMVACWTNFAKYGDPTPFDDLDLPSWQPVTLEKKNYMDLKPNPELKVDVAPKRMMFWNRLIWAPKETAILLRKAAQIFNTSY